MNVARIRYCWLLPSNSQAFEVSHPLGDGYEIAASFEKYCPFRVIDTAISEGGFTGAAVGAALAGQKPIVELQFYEGEIFCSCQIGVFRLANDFCCRFAAVCTF